MDEVLAFKMAVCKFSKESMHVLYSGNGDWLHGFSINIVVVGEIML